MAESDLAQGPKPNHFLCMQISNPKVRESLKNVQDSIVERYKEKKKVDLTPCLKADSSFHINFMVMRLNNDRAIEKACDGLEKCYKMFMKFESDPLNVKFQGIDNYSGQIFFSKVKPGPAKTHLQEIAKVVKKTFAGQSVRALDDRPFNPHVTILHLKPSLKDQLGIDKIDDWVYEDFRETLFGGQRIKSLQLCQKGRPSHEPYYKVVHELYF